MDEVLWSAVVHTRNVCASFMVPNASGSIDADRELHADVRMHTCRCGELRHDWLPKRWAEQHLVMAAPHFDALPSLVAAAEP